MRFWFVKNWFLFSLFAAGSLGLLFPQAGASGGWLRTEVTTLVGVAVLFFIRGTLLPLAELRRGFLLWRLHLVVHAYIFLLLPITVVVILELVELVFPVHPELRLGFIFLSVLPTTVSTAAVFTSLARGNTAAAVFNATASNVLGVFIVPLWVGWMLQREAQAVPVGPVILQVVGLVLVPLLAGQAVKPFLPELTLGQKKSLENFSSLIVLYVLFAAFANSTAAGVWEAHGWGLILGGTVLAGVLFVVGTGLAHFGGKLLRLDRGDYICLFFAGPQKTLASGVTIANVMFVSEPGLALILLPTLVYHFIQLFAGGFAVERFRRAPDSSA
jgi:solute carrier family 10 (sodium/bile acid cotransporter), member 7